MGEPDRGDGPPSSSFTGGAGLGAAYPAESQRLPGNIWELLYPGDVVGPLRPYMIVHLQVEPPKIASTNSASHEFT